MSRGYVGGDSSYGMIDNPGVSTIEDHYARMRVYPRGFDMTLSNATELMGSIGAINTSENTGLFDGGIELSGTGKWLGGVLAPNGKIYGIPHNSNTVLCIDPSNNTTSTFGDLSGTGKWSGGVLAPNGKIYGIPYSSTTVLCISGLGSTSSATLSLIHPYFNKL